MNLIKKDATNPNTGEKRPTHERVYFTLRDQVLFGDMAPGQAVTIQGLTESLGVGMTPVREAIRRLISDGALVFQGNRRVKVPEMTASDVEQITFLRSQIEAELARRAVQDLTPEQVDVLEAIDMRVDAAILAGDVEGYLRHNHAFHAAIYERANAPVMVDLAERLWLRFGPSLRVVCGRFGTQTLPDRHKDMLQAMRTGDADAVARAIVQDVEQGMELVAGVIAEQAA